MFRTIIADDDFLVRSYLKQLTAWEQTGYEIIADVRDGEEALRVIQKEKPDVLITDIAMPLMDGIELIREIKQLGLEIYIIVLSCHDDFEYVKEAMKLGADEYVLKNSLDEENLVDLLRNAEHQIQARQVKQTEKEHTDRLIKMGSHSLKYHFFNGILSGSLADREREEKRKEAGIQGKYGNSAVMNLFIPNWHEVKLNLTTLEQEQYSRAFLKRLMEGLELSLGAEYESVEAIYLGEGVFCSFLDLSSLRRSSLMRQKLTSVASACFRCCEKESYSYVIGVSNICFGEDGIRQAYQQAREMMKLYFYEEGDVLYYDTQKAIGIKLPASAEEISDHIKYWITERKANAISVAFEHFTEECSRLRVDYKLIIHWLKELDKKLKVDKDADYYAKLIKAEQLHAVCDEYREFFFGDQKREIPKGVGSGVRLAMEFIHDHYKKQIGLNDVADAVGLNPAYLSYVFKQESGIGFSNYLLNCRMQCARELLSKTNYKIKEVAQESGFNDYHYFSKAFKKLNGCSPADYRKQEHIQI